MPSRVYLAARAETFSLVEWEVRQIAAQAGVVASELVRAPKSDAADLERVRDYLLAPRGERGDGRTEAERAIERELSALIEDQGVARLPLVPTPGLFPPVAFAFTSPPSVLIVAPRDRLVVQQSMFVKSGLSDAQAGDVEHRVGSLGLSSLVTPIGGLATYPSMVVESTRGADVLSSVAHEWVHAYLFFRPLGATYWSSQEGRAINETVADLAGRELGAKLAERVGLPQSAAPPRGGADEGFRAYMRETRLEVERLLASGAVDEAEQYMERRRIELDGLGYRIRRLNQAYFAFYGSYAESVAGDNRIGSLVRSLREGSPDLATFLARVSNVQSTGDVRRLIAGS